MNLETNSQTLTKPLSVFFYATPSAFYKTNKKPLRDGKTTATAAAMAVPTTAFRFAVLVLLVGAGIGVELSYPAVFNFGDSNSDTGGLVASAVGEHLPPPNGQSFFGRPAGRFCDGRLVVDFLMDAMGLPFLNTYLDSIGAPSFQKGCNFAVGGSQILPATSTDRPFSFGIQLTQFSHFRQRVLELSAKGNKFKKYIPPLSVFSDGLYMFDIGQNDLTIEFHSQSEDQVLSSIPTILSEFESGLKALYDQGARRFWIHNTGPLGCLSVHIATFGKDSSKLDELGCVSSQNRIAKIFNLQLHTLYRRLQGDFANASIIHTDIFSIKYDLIANYSRYGFEHPITTCCGYGRLPLNYDSRIPCGQTMIINGSSVTANACSDTTKYVNWDGMHYTEAANRHISSQILSGKYSDPPFADKMSFLLRSKF